MRAPLLSNSFEMETTHYIASMFSREIIQLVARSGGINSQKSRNEYINYTLRFVQIPWYTYLASQFLGEVIPKKPYCLRYPTFVDSSWSLK